MTSRITALLSSSLLAAAAALLLAVPDPAAAQTGEVTGEVADATTGRPLEGAQVFIEGTGIGTLTNAQGRYVLLNVPEGEVTIRVELLGYGRQEETVTVPAGDVVNLDFGMRESAVALDELVVTGAGAQTERRKLGNTLASIQPSEAVQTGSVSNFSELLQGREPGVEGLPTSGLTGEGARIRIRGSSSLSQSNEPLVYVDGVRVDNAGGFGTGVGAGGGGTPSRLDDLNPSAIDRVEILKGAAAATLYGSEASSGVIQIFTKQGQQGDARWDLRVEQGVSQFPQRYHDAELRCGYSVSATPTEQADGIVDRGTEHIKEYWGVSVEPYEVFCVDMFDRLDILETGYNQAYDLSVSGGSETMRYYVSGRFSDADGPIGAQRWGPARDQQSVYNATSNVTFFPREDLRIRVSSNYTHRFNETMDNNNNIFGVLTKTTDSNPVSAWEGNPTGSNTFVTVPEAMQRQTFQETDHFSGSSTVSFSPTGSISLEGTFGADYVSSKSVEHVPFGWNVNNFTTFDVEGDRGVNKRHNLESSVDLKGTWEEDLTDDFASSFVVGSQLFVTQQSQTFGSGTNFPGPGLEVTGAGAEQSTFESRLQEVIGGVFAQEQVGYRDWAFLTVGGRFDKHSAFGETVGGQFYPKASVSVVPSDRDGFDIDAVSTLRLRAAIGQSGLQPGAFDRFTTFQPLPSEEGPGIAPDNLGNEDLKPEVSTEWELGGEVAVFDDRFGLETTYWNRTVTDVMVDRQFAPTGGFMATQLDNIGEMKAWGLELGVTASVYQSRNHDVDLFANASYLNEEITDMGAAPPLKVGGSYPRYRNWVREGYAPGAFFGAKPMDVEYPISPDGTCEPGTRDELLEYFSEPRTPDEITILEEGCGTEQALDHYLGKPTPDWQGSFGGTFRFLDRFEVSTLFEYKARNYQVHDLTLAFHQHNPLLGRNEPESAQVEATLMNPESTPEERLEAGVAWVKDLAHLSPYAGMNSIFDADFLRWRELSLTYRAPSAWIEGIGGRSLSLSVAGRNIALWTKWPGSDPEANQLGRGEGGGLSNNFLTGVNAWSVPLPWRVSFSARVGF